MKIKSTKFFVVFLLLVVTGSLCAWDFYMKETWDKGHFWAGDTEVVRRLPNGNILKTFAYVAPYENVYQHLFCR